MPKKLSVLNRKIEIDNHVWFLIIQPSCDKRSILYLLDITIETPNTFDKMKIIRHNETDIIYA